MAEMAVTSEEVIVAMISILKLINSWLQIEAESPNRSMFSFPLSVHRHERRKHRKIERLNLEICDTRKASFLTQRYAILLREEATLGMLPRSLGFEASDFWADI